MPITLENTCAQTPGRQYVWLKGNLHLHFHLDRRMRAANRRGYLRQFGYRFLALTDHDMLSNYSALDPTGMILLPGNEVTAYGNHILQNGGTSRSNP